MVKTKKIPIQFEESVTKNGATRTYVSIKFPLFESSNNIIAIAGISTDITERKQSEIQLKKLSKESERNEMFLNETGGIESPNQQQEP